jgi:hypothetical protein
MTLLSNLDNVIESLRDTVTRQLQDRDPAHADFATWGWALDGLITQLDDVGQVLTQQVSAYGTRRSLTDDENMNPYARLAEAAEMLKKMTKSLEAANESARRFHAAIGHLRVAVSPTAPSD